MARRWSIRLLTAGIGLAVSSCQSYSLRQGDLLFHVAPQGNAITAVTADMLDHVAIALSKDSVIEAVDRGVVITPLDSLRRQPGYYIIGRVRQADRRQSVENARRYLGRAYDHVFLATNSDIYCSELVQLSYVDKHGQPLFTTIPMSFHDATGHITDYWRTFYARRGMDVPEGQPGTNPAELSKRPVVRLCGRLR